MSGTYGGLYGGGSSGGGGGGGALPSLTQYRGWQGDATNTAVEVPWLSSSIARTLSVAPVAGTADHSTIGAALTAAAALAPTAASPVAIYVFPGTYNVTATIAIPDNVAVKSVAGSAQTIISSATFLPAGVVTVGNNAALIGFTVESTANSNIVDIDNGAGSPAYLDDLFLTGNGRPLEVGTAGSSVRGGVIRHVVSGTFGGDPVVVNAGTVDIQHLHVENSSSMNSAVFCNGTLLRIGRLTAIGVGNTAALRCQGGELRVESGFITANNSNQFLLNATVGATITVLNLGCTVYVRANLVNTTTTGTIRGYIFDVDDPDEAENIYGELSVGRPNDPKEASFGHGDSTPAYMAVLSGNGGTFTNNTTTAKAPTGTFSLFRSATIGEGLYIGATNKQWAGFKINGITTALAGGALTFSYWNGASWSAMHVMAADDDSPHDQYAETVFQRTGDEHVYIDLDSIRATWASTSINSISAFWIKIEQSTAVSTVPVATQIKIHYNTAEITEDGSVVYYGDARPLRTIPGVHLKLTDNAAGGGSPINQPLDFSTNINLTTVNNEFRTGQNDRLGGVAQLPEGVDTSGKMTIRLKWNVNGVATGTVRWILYTCQAKDGAVLQGALTEDSVTIDEVIAGAADDTIQSTDFTFDVETLVPGEEFAFVLERDGTIGGNLAANTYAVSLQAYAKYWKG